MYNLELNIGRRCIRVDAQGDGHDATRRDATWRRVRISALTTPLNHSPTGSELASVNSLAHLSLRPVSPSYLLNVIKWAFYSFLLLFFSSHRPFTLEGSRKRIDNAHGSVGYTKIVWLLEKPAGSSRCRYPVYGRLYHCCYALESDRRKRERERERDSLDERQHSKVSWQLYAQRKSLLSIFYTVRPGELFRARVRSRVTLFETPVSPLSLSIERNRGAPFKPKLPQMCSKIRRARQIGKNQTRPIRDLLITRSSQTKIN